MCKFNHLFSYSCHFLEIFCIFVLRNKNYSMKRIILGCLLWCSAIGSVFATEVPQIVNVLSRKTTSLNGAWHYIVDVQEEGYYDYRMNPTRWGFFRNAKPGKPEDLIEYDFDAAPTMKIPGDWNTQDDRLFFYEGTVWLKRSFQFEKKALIAGMRLDAMASRDLS